MNIVEIFQFALGKATQTFLELWPLLLLSVFISVHSNFILTKMLQIF
jgi:hypothetical protein